MLEQLEQAIRSLRQHFPSGEEYVKWDVNNEGKWSGVVPAMEQKFLDEATIPRRPDPLPAGIVVRKGHYHARDGGYLYRKYQLVEYSGKPTYRPMGWEAHWKKARFFIPLDGQPRLEVGSLGPLDIREAYQQRIVRWTETGIVGYRDDDSYPWKTQAVYGEINCEFAVEAGLWWLIGTVQDLLATQ